ncbi:MAG: hypothetical protein M3308_01255 [Actinomycetota bacterium]|nr:hypothetical protein [Actinomycetota bacterium]
MAKTTKTRARQSARTGSFEIFTYPQRSTPARIAGLLWRWRIELMVLTVLVITWAWLVDRLPTWGAWLCLLGTLAVLLAVPVSRRYVLRRIWCVISRHRVRKCFVQARVMTHEGLLPLFIWTRPTPVGERLRIWLRPGLSVRDIETTTDRIAAACWARDARVQVHPKRVSTVWVHVIRRDPLAGSGQISSPLLDGITPNQDEEYGQLIPLPDRATVTAAMPAPGTAGEAPISTHSATATRATAPKRTTTRSTPAADENSAPVVLGWSGEDVSDYV